MSPAIKFACSVFEL